MDRSTLSSAVVARAAGVTYRQLDYWVRCGLYPDVVRAPGSGSARRWHHRHVAVTAVYASLQRMGAGMEVCARVASWLVDLEGPWSGHLVVAPDGSLGDADTREAWLVDLHWCWSHAEPARALACAL